MAAEKDPWFLKTTFPVLFPTHSALALPNEEFEVFIKSEIDQMWQEEEETADDVPESDVDDSFTIVSADQSTTADIQTAVEGMDIEAEAEPPMDEAEPKEDEQPTHPFIEGLKTHDMPNTPEPEYMENKMYTANMDVTHQSTENPLVDLFSSLETVIDASSLSELLSQAWAEDPLMTLKIIFNARSIHLGKSDKMTFYRCAGWLADNHPLTLLFNLRWLSRPVIEKKVKKKDGEDGDIVLVEAEKDEKDVTRFDVKDGVAHGYWKDLLNILALSANDLLDSTANPRDILNIERERSKEETPCPDKETAKGMRRRVRDERHQNAIWWFDSDPLHRALHMIIARLFAEQLREDTKLLRSGDPQMKSRISLCAKWAPSHARFHDKHTFIVSTIAELLHPIAKETDRELYLRHARELYRRDVSALRQHLDVVERKLTAKTLDKIKYDRVPSLAMNNYARIFEEKGKTRFTEYIMRVTEGKAKISGATLLPSTLISKVSRAPEKNTSPLALKVIDAQWNTLVQRIKDSGTMESSIAVCDVSGSMQSIIFPDDTYPIDSSIGLSLLVAEVTAPPFGGTFITFSEKPTVETINLKDSLDKKYNMLKDSCWGFNTNFVAVFEDLILPMAKREQLKPEDMVKRVFVFSDMQFDQADSGRNAWTTSYERIKRKYAEEGYEMPQMVFWNLAAGAIHLMGGSYAMPPKPVTMQDNGTALVSGYSQGMLKVFLENGSFEDTDVSTEEETEKGDEDEEKKEGSPSKKRKIDPLLTVKKAVNHKAYSMLKVFD